jgi:glycosyltransferase involved in cell wall biosynthesis
MEGCHPVTEAAKQYQNLMSEKSISIVFYDNSAVDFLANPSEPAGGAAKQLLTWSRGLQSLGINTMVMGPSSNYNLSKQNPNIIVSYNPSQGIPKFRYLYLRVPKIFRAIYRSKAEYVYSSTPGEESGVLAIISKIQRKKFILRISNDYYIDRRFKERADLIRYFFHFLGLKLADFILCQNEYQLGKVRKLYPTKTFMISNPFMGKAVTNPVSFEKREGIAWVANIRYEKNISLLLEIAELLPHIQFRIAGKILPNIDEDSKTVIEKLKLLGNVSILGFLDEEQVLNLMGNSHILLNTSHTEGFANSFLEAFSVGTPVSTLNQNDPNNIIKIHELGFTFSSAGDFKDNYLNLIHDQNTYARLSENCQRYLKRNHDLQKQSNEFLQIISSNDSTS